MNLYIIYLLAVAGLVFITNKSKLFLNIRKYISIEHDKALNASVMQSNTYQGIWWFLDSIFCCSMCMSIWAGAILLLAWYAKLFVVLYVLAAVAPTTMIISLWELWNRR